MDMLERGFSNAIVREKNAFIRAQSDSYTRTRKLSIDLLMDHKRNMSSIFKKHGARTIRVFIGDTERNLPKSAGLFNLEKKRDLFSLLFSEWITEEGGANAKETAETTFDDLNKILTSSVAASEPTGVIARQLLTVQGLSRFRANTIARTETHNAAMFASKRTAETLAADVDIKILKQWIPALDERTRVSHAAMVSHPAISMDGRFDVGGEKLDRPGDPSGSPANIINCRCVLVYEELE